MKTSFLFLAEGFEEIEALTAVDVLRRAEIPVKTVSITSSLQVKGAHGITVAADLIYDNTLFDSPAWIIFPGGLPGAQYLSDFAPLHGLIRSQMESKSGRIAAICAAPALVLGQHGYLKGVKATCYPGFESKLEGADVQAAPVVSDGKFLTANGPATAMDWALTLVSETLGKHRAEEVGAGMLCYSTDPRPFEFG